MKLFLLPFVLMLSIASTGQETFSKLHALGGNSTLAGIHEVEDGYVVHGAGALDDPFVGLCFFWKLNWEGEIEKQVIVGNDSLDYHARRASAQFADGTLLVGALVTMPDTSWVELFWLDQDLNITQTKQYTSPLYDTTDPTTDSFVGLQGLEVTESGLIYLILGTYNEETNNDYVVLQLDQDGAINWSYVRNIDEGIDRCWSTDTKGDSLVVSNYSTFSGRQILALTTSGDIAWEFDFVDSYGGGNLPLDLFWNGDVLICGANAYFDSPDLLRQPMIHATDTTGNMLWYGAVGDDFGWDQFMYQVEAVCDGYVGFSQKNTDEDPDTGWDNTLGWVIRVEEGGELAWERKYGFAETAAYTNEFTDLIATSDGGILLCGSSINLFNPNPPDQKSWTLKLDACGCLVPGCDPECSNPCAPWNAIPDEAYFLYGPNPVSDLLSLYVKPAVSDLSQPEFVLRDGLGRAVDFFVPTDQDITYLWPLELSAGGYVLSLEDGGVPVQTEKVVVR